jgi:Ca-activated chloride channel family protein
MRRIPAVVLLFVPAVVLAADKADAADKTLSPFFFVEGGDPAVDRLPLEKTSVELGISGVIADVTVVQIYKNDGKRPINARYVFPASTRAAVHGMKMTVGNKVIEARIKERGEARKEFEEAKQAGKSASLLEQDRPNVFTMNVANVMPGDRIAVELRYTELLVPDHGVYELAYPTVVGPRYSNQPASEAPAHDKFVASPYTPAGEAPTYQLELKATVSSAIPIRELASPSHKIQVTRTDAKLLSVALDPSEAAGGNRDFLLRYRLAGDAVQTGLLLYESKGESFFLFMAEPPQRVVPEMIPPREYVFIVDVSGSMQGFPLDTSKALIRDLVSGLRPTDRFNVILFSGGTAMLAERSVPATRDHIERALHVIDEVNAGGGTELVPALKTALTMPHDAGWARTFVAVTDGYISAEPEAFDIIRKHLGDANFFAFGIGTSVNRYLIEGLARAGAGEPFVVTDAKQGEVAAARFREYVASPVLTDVKLSFENFDAYDLEPPAIPDVLSRRPVVVHGKWRGPLGGKVTVRGVSGQGRYEHIMDVAQVRASAENRALPFLWARTRIANLSDFGVETEQSKAEIIKLGLTYNLLTRYTSFVAVLQEKRNDGAADDVAQPLPMPEGVENSALPLESGDEPELLFLLGLLGLLAMLVVARRRRARS